MATQVSSFSLNDGDGTSHAIMKLVKSNKNKWEIMTIGHCFRICDNDRCVPCNASSDGSMPCIAWVASCALLRSKYGNFFKNPNFPKKLSPTFFFFFFLHFGEFSLQKKHCFGVMHKILNLFWSNNKTQHEILKFFLVVYLKICIEITSKIKCFLHLWKSFFFDFECKLIKQLNIHLFILICLKPLMKNFIFYLEYFLDNFNIINHLNTYFNPLEMRIKNSINYAFLSCVFRQIVWCIHECVDCPLSWNENEKGFDNDIEFV